MSRLVLVLLLAAGAVRAAHAQGTPTTALRVKERAQRAANAASARNRQTASPETPAATQAQPAPAKPAAQPAPGKPAAQPAPGKPAAQPAQRPAVANKPSVDTPAESPAPGGSDASPAAPAGRRNRAARPDATAPAPAPAVARTDAPTRAAATADTSARGSKGQVAFRREVYAYEGGGRRDPFVSLVANGELRPDITALRVAAILYDPTGRNSVAILRDTETKEQYRARAGQTLGRMRVTRIEPKRVTFSIDEFGFNRQEVLLLESPNERTP